MTRSFSLLSLAGVAVAATACAHLTVHSFTGRDVDFKTYHTYQWAKDPPRATGDPRVDSNPFFEGRLVGTTERELAAKGFEKVAGTNSDLVLHYYASVSQQLDVAPRDLAYEVCQNCGASSVYEAGTIVLDFVDARTNTLVWRSWAEGSIDGAIDNQRWMEERIDEAIRKIVATVPGRI